MTGAGALEVDNLAAGYGSLRVLHGVSLTVGRGEVVALLGANGAGKTTTLRAICGLAKVTSGEIRIGGAAVRGRSPERIARLGVAHVPQGRGTFPNLTVEENLRAGVVARRIRDVDDRLGRWYDFFPRLHDRRVQRAGSLSGGEQQMLAIARAMIGGPQLLLLDEPSMGLAPNITAQLFERLAEINQAEGTALLVVEQNAKLALSLARYAFVLEAGEISVSGAATALESDDRVRQAYLRV